MFVHAWTRLLFVVLVADAGHAYEYCTGKDELCSGNARHIICHPEQIGQGADLVAMVPMTSKLRRVLLELHNAYRNNTACGAIQDSAGAKFPAATRMRELLWDEELAYIARVHAAHCKMEHDQCRNTERFPSSGQNLASATFSEKRPILEVLQQAVTGWYEEYKLLPSGEAAAKLYPKEVADIGHFTAMVNDRVSRVGCATAYCTQDSGSMPHQYYTTCNYDNTNIEGRLVYDSGTAAGSKCAFWGSESSEVSGCLCTNTGEVFNALD